MSARLLWILWALFVLRVLAQLAQVRGDVAWLPPFEAWHGGVLPYPALLTAQLAIAAALARIAWQVSTGRFRAAPRAGRLWLGLGGLYFAGMAVRLLLGLTLLSDDRWWGAHLPAFFHLVLAGFMLRVGWLHRTRA